MIVLVIKLKSPMEMKLAWRSGQKLGLVACLPMWLVETLSNTRLPVDREVVILYNFSQKVKGEGGDGGNRGSRHGFCTCRMSCLTPGKRLYKRGKSESKQDIPNSIYYVTNQEGLQEIADSP